jgi:hypothetical protein
MMAACIDCGEPAAWVRRTQFSGDHPYCDTHARAQADFGERDPSYFFWQAVAPGPLVIPDDLLALAAGIEAGNTELSWEQITTILEKAGLGSYKPDDLVRAVDVYLMGKGTSRGRLGAECRRATGRRLPVENITVSIGFKDPVKP